MRKANQGRKVTTDIRVWQEQYALIDNQFRHYQKNERIDGTRLLASHSAMLKNFTNLFAFVMVTDGGLPSSRWTITGMHEIYPDFDLDKFHEYRTRIPVPDECKGFVDQLGATLQNIRSKAKVGVYHDKEDYDYYKSQSDSGVRPMWYHHYCALSNLGINFPGARTSTN